MYATTGREMELLASQLLMDLCFLDDRDADAERERSPPGSTPHPDGPPCLPPWNAPD